MDQMDLFEVMFEFILNYINGQPFGEVRLLQEDTVRIF